VPLARDYLPTTFKSATIHDLGRYLLISSPSKEDVGEALSMLATKYRARVIAGVQQLGVLWIGSCSHPLDMGDRRQAQPQMRSTGARTDSTSAHEPQS